MGSNTTNQLVKLGDICQEVRISTKDPLADGLERYIGLEHLDSGSLKIKRWGSIQEDNPSFTKVFRKGQILFGKRRPYLKKAAVAEFDGICSSDIIVLKPTPKMPVPELLPFIIQSDETWDFAIKTSSGSLSPRTKWKSLSQKECLLPDEQRQLDLLEILKKIQTNINHLENLKHSLNRLKNSLELDIFNKLSLVHIDDIAEVKTGATPRRGISEYWDGNINWMSSGEIHEKFLYKTKEKITALGLKNSNTTILPINTVVMAMNGQGITRGKVALTKIETTCNQSIAAIIFDNKQDDPLFMFFYLDSKYHEIRGLTGEGRKGLNLKLVRSIKVPDLEIEKQKKISSIFMQLYSISKDWEVKVQKLQDISQSIIKFK